MKHNILPGWSEAKTHREVQPARRTRDQARGPRIGIGRCARLRSTTEKTGKVSDRTALNCGGIIVLRRSNSAPCVDGPCGARGFLTFRQAGRVRSCVRPVCAVLMTAGPDGSSRTRSQSSSRTRSAGHYSGFPSPRLNRFAITSLHPLQSVTGHIGSLAGFSGASRERARSQMAP